MSRPGNTTRITDSRDAPQDATSTEVRSAHGQPRPSGLEIARMPSAAERTRTLVQSTCSAVLIIPPPEGAPEGTAPAQLVPDARSVGPGGAIVLVLDGDSPTAGSVPCERDSGRSAVLEITDVAPVSVPHRIRGRAWKSPRPTWTTSGAPSGWRRPASPTRSPIRWPRTRPICSSTSEPVRNVNEPRRADAHALRRRRLLTATAVLCQDASPRSRPRTFSTTSAYRASAPYRVGA